MKGGRDRGCKGSEGEGECKGGTERGRGREEVSLREGKEKINCKKREERGREGEGYVEMEGGKEKGEEQGVERRRKEAEGGKKVEVKVGLCHSNKTGQLNTWKKREGFWEEGEIAHLCRSLLECNSISYAKHTPNTVAPFSLKSMAALPQSKHSES